MAAAIEPRRHPDLHADRAAHPRDGQDAARPAAAARPPAARRRSCRSTRRLSTASSSGSSSRARNAADRHRHERGRVVAHRAADSLSSSIRARRASAATRRGARRSGCRSSRFPGPRPTSARAAAAASGRASACGCSAEEDYLARDAYTPPEIQRTNLAAVILQTKALRLGRSSGSLPRSAQARGGARRLPDARRARRVDDQRRADRDRPPAEPPAGRSADWADDSGRPPTRAACTRC